jgi:hypothetical protein
MSPLFLDTSYVITVEAEDDQHHREAISDKTRCRAAS